ncbi:MAG: rod shape-determining protein MreC [Bacteroidota bacterium]|nr:rod shape-determining protein MreC [Bacteroidota bacterium]MDP4233504.1 rod shape-determining protein MreC [Bacteroidota bacterium]MDP4243381.1 rod shape-determining protein MreC [Bacteroidota bacterium]MDP4287932.1 rod shape-determining protein MreC [Bacteroidota bacterium]
MRRFLDLIIAFKEYVALTVFVSASLTMIAVSRTTDVMPLRAFATGVVGSIQSIYSWIPNPVTLRRENRELEAKSIELAAEVGRLRRAEAENSELRRLLGIGPHPGWKLAAAEVVGKTTSFQRNMLTINLGSNEHVVPGMAVMTDAGLVGRVYAASANFSLVQMLFNTDLRIASKIARTRVEGIVAWDGGPTLVMRNVPKALDVEVGDLVVSSEYSSFFAADIPIGTIIRMEPEPNSLFRRITLEPAVNLFRVEHVYVVLKDEARERERLSLEALPEQPPTKLPKR